MAKKVDGRGRKMTENNDLEIMANDAIGSIERAQIDVQIATARRYPRTLSKVKERMLSFATLDEETASSCFYTLPARRGGDDKPIQGPSVRMAEIALASYQHVKAGSRIIADDGKFIVAQAVVHDLENNVSVSIEVRRRVTSKKRGTILRRHDRSDRQRGLLHCPPQCGLPGGSSGTHYPCLRGCQAGGSRGR